MRPERVTLPRDINDFLVELSVALHRYSMYPAGHPSLEPAVEAVTRRVQTLLEDRSSLAVGVTRRQLLVDDIATDPEQPVLRRLAEGLHRHHIAAMSVTPGVQAAEFAEALRRLSADAERDGPIDLGSQAQANWPHLILHPLAFDGLTLRDDASSADSQQSDAPARRDLWAELARAAVQVENVGDDTRDREKIDPAVVARSIEEHAVDERYDGAIVTFLIEIAHELTTASPEKVQELQQRVQSLISSLKSETLRRLLQAGTPVERRGQFMRDVAHGMAIDAVLDIVKAASDDDHQTISHGLLRMLSKMATHARQGSDLARPHADHAFREQVLRLLDDWDLDDPNPAPYGRTLHRVATAKTDGSDAGQSIDAAVALRVVQMSLETNTFPPLAEDALDDVIRTGQLSGVFELLSSTPPESAAVSDAMLLRLTRPETLKTMLGQDRVDMAGLDALLPRLSAEAHGPLLDAIGSSPNRAVRRRLLDRLAQTQVDIAPLVIERLADERWFVQRNMLMLLERSGRIPEGFSPHRWTQHPDARVRLEAVRLQMAMPLERNIGIRASLHDVDSRVMRLGLAAIQQDRSADLVGRLIEIAGDTALEQEIRSLAVTAMGRDRDEAVLRVLLRLTDGGRSFFGRLRLPLKSAVLLASVRALSEVWPDDARAARVLAVAARSSDPEIRQAASRTS